MYRFSFFRGQAHVSILVQGAQFREKYGGGTLWGAMVLLRSQAPKAVVEAFDRILDKRLLAPNDEERRFVDLG